MTQAREELADLINRVAYGHERIVLTRHSKPVACLVPPEDLARLEEQETPGFSSTPAAPGTSPQPVLPGPMPIAAQHRPGPLRG